MSAKRAIIRLQLESSAKQGLDDLCERRGMTQIAVMSRLVRWLVAQDEVVQASVLGLLSEQTLGDLSQALLKRLAAGAGGSAAGGPAAGTRSGRSGGGARSKSAPRAAESEGRLLDQ
jgi:hypothetical protein